MSYLDFFNDIMACKTTDDVMHVGSRARNQLTQDSYNRLEHVARIKIRSIMGVS